MRIIINLEDGDSFLYEFNSRLTPDLDSLLSHLQLQLKEEFQRNYILFYQPGQKDHYLIDQAKPQKASESLQILKNASKEIIQDGQHLYMYPRETMMKVVNTAGNSLWNFRSDLNLALKPTKSSKVTPMTLVKTEDQAPDFNTKDKSFIKH
jgi:hypothetical protein